MGTTVLFANHSVNSCNYADGAHAVFTRSDPELDLFLMQFALRTVMQALTAIVVVSLLAWLVVAVVAPQRL